MMKIYGQDNTEIMQIHSLERDGNRLVLKGKVFGTMPISARLTPQEGRNGLKLLNFKVALFSVWKVLCQFILFMIEPYNFKELHAFFNKLFFFLMICRQVKQTCKKAILNVLMHCYTNIVQNS